MSNFTNPQKVVRGFTAVITGCWVYCLVVAPILSEQSYADAAIEKSKDIGIGFTIGALLVGAIWLFIANKKSNA